MPTLKLRLLGSPQIELDNQRLDVKPRKALALLIYLACHADAQPRDRLATLFWPEASQSEARAALRRRLSEVATLLGEGWLESRRESVHLLRNPTLWVDIIEFEQRLAEVKEHTHPSSVLCATCLAKLNEAAALYGDFLDGFTLVDCPDFDSWQRIQGEHLRLGMVRTLEQLVLYHSTHGELALATTVARTWLTLDPLQEEIHRQLMHLYLRLGRRADALRQYEECRRLLANELDIQPDEETQALYRQIRSETKRVITTAPAYDLLPSVSASSGLSEPPSQFVAREKELAALALALEMVRSGHGQLRFVIGEAGQGKSVLVQEFARQAQRRESRLLVIRGHCNAYTGIGDPYLPFREAFTQLAGEGEREWGGSSVIIGHAQNLRTALSLTLPALVAHAPDLIGSFVSATTLLARAATIAAPQTPWVKQLSAIAAREQPWSLDERAIFAQFSAALKAIAAHQPLLLILEDLHWVDQSSCALLFYLSRALAGSRILILGTYRAGDVIGGRGAEAHPLADMIGEFKRQHGAIWLDLGALTVEEGRAFVEAYLDTTPNQLHASFRQTFFHHTGGHALFTVELLRTMQARRDLYKDTGGQWIANQEIEWNSLPVKIEGVIERQLARLDNPLQAILRVACIQGENFSAEVIAQVLKLDTQQVISQLSQILSRQQHLVNALDVAWVGTLRVSRYHFRHYLFQRYLYQSLDESERVYLHEMVGVTLEGLYAQQLEQIALELAHHYRQAHVFEKAVSALFRAGERARTLGAYHEAIQHLQEGLSLLQTLPSTMAHQEQEIDFLIALGTAMGSAGDFDTKAIETFFMRARTLCEQTGNRKKLLSVLAGLHFNHFERGNYLQCHANAEELLQLSLGMPEALPRLIAHWLLGFAYMAFGDFALCLQHSEAALYELGKVDDLGFQYNHVDPKIDALTNIAFSKWIIGYPDQAHAFRDEVIRGVQALNHPYQAAIALLQVTWIDDIRQEVNATSEDVAALIRIAGEHNYYRVLGHAHIFEGCIAIAQRRAEVGLAQLQQGIAELHAMGNTIAPCHHASLQARGYLALGQAQSGIEVIDAAFALGAQSGEHWFDAELHRQKGELLQLDGAPFAVVEGYFEEAIAIAHRQGGKLFELRATVSLCRLWQAHGSTSAAYTRLADLYAWFTEGFATPDLVEARNLLAALR